MNTEKFISTVRNIIEETNKNPSVKKDVTGLILIKQELKKQKK